MANGLTEAEEARAGLGLGEPYEPLPPAAEGEYSEGLAAILYEQIQKGLIYPEDALRITANIDQYIAARGLTPALPYWQTIQRQIAGKPLMEWYERMKPSILQSTLSPDEKIRSLMKGHPRTGAKGVRGEIIRDVLASLSPEEAKRQQDIWDTQLGGAPLRAMARRYQPTYPSYEPFRPEPAFEEMRTGLKGTQPWKDWFASRYPTLLRQFKATTAKPTEETWSQYLKRRKAELKEKWWGLGPYGRGERPSAFAPKIKTVGF